MTVSATHTKNLYLSDGITRNWPYTFSLNHEDHVSIFVSSPEGQVKQIHSGYRVDMLKKVICYPVVGNPLATGWKVALLRKTPLTQEMDLVNNGGFFPETIEKAFDRAVLVEQEFREEMDRSVRVPETEANPTDFVNDLLGAKWMAQESAQEAKSARDQAEISALAAAEHTNRSSQEADRADDAATLAERYAEQAAVGGIRVINGKTGSTVALTYEDINAASQEHRHENSNILQDGFLSSEDKKKLDWIPATGEYDEGKVLVSRGEDRGYEWIYMSGVPVGTIIAWSGTKAPVGYLECAGQILSQNTYPDLFAILGHLYDGTAQLDSYQFKLPDYRGEFLRGWDHGRGIDQNRDMGTRQGDAIRNITGTTAWYNSLLGFSFEGAFYDAGTATTADANNGSTPAKKIGLDASKVVPTANENRPRNITVMYCIKAFDGQTNPGLVESSSALQELSEKVNRVEFANQLSENGWSKLPNGLIMQWGKVAKPAAEVSVVFPRPFTTACLSVQQTAEWTSGIAYYNHIKTGSITKTGFTIIGTSQAATYYHHWFAIGF
ncbi:MAG: tail fiber protein [Negativicutes bacterium]|nr:tail fiber protein [Negativicutes bacterium]